MQPMKTLGITIVICGFLMGSLPAHAKIYKWVDENGKAHFTNDPTLIPQNEDASIKTFREIPPVSKVESKESTSEKQTDPLHEEKGTVNLVPPLKSKPKKEATPANLAEQKESYKELLKKSYESRDRQLKKIAELQEMDEKPKNWTTKETLDKIIEGLQRSVKKSKKEIRKYEKKINSFSLTD